MTPERQSGRGLGARTWRATLGDAVEEVRTHWRDREWWRKRFLTHVVGRYFTDVRRPPADPLVDEEWDNAVVLDACRYDLFADVLDERPLPGTLERRRSAQSGTPGFLRENFAGDAFHDVVYVTANPYVSTVLPDDTFHDVVSVWREDWDEDAGTVGPGPVVERALAAAESYPDKRLIIHFNQPHAPFLGDTDLAGRGMDGIRATAMGDRRPDPRDRRRTPFERLARGELSRDDVWDGYRENLTVAWDGVAELLGELSGLTAVTADHGNALGERAWPFPICVYGHPLGILTPPLTEVPWFTSRNGPRKTVTAEAPVDRTRTTDDIADRLRDLGYRA